MKRFLDVFLTKKVEENMVGKILIEFDEPYDLLRVFGFLFRWKKNDTGFDFLVMEQW